MSCTTDRYKHLRALRQFLGELGVVISQDDQYCQDQAQIVIYLGQRMGADLGYRSGWYKRGLRCNELNEDTKELWWRDPEPVEGEQLLGDRVLKALSSTCELLEPRGEIDRWDWGWLMANLDYLVKVARFSPSQARETIISENPRVASWVDEAETALREFGLWPAVDEQ